jgi:hypothetical protein
MSLKPGNINMPTIYIISEYVDPKINSTGYYWSKIINGVSSAFSRATVICPEHGAVEGYPFESSRVSVLPITQTSYKKNHLLFRLLGLLNLSRKFLFKILKSVKKNDLILDIGGNDGTQMLQYKLAGIKNVINVESAVNIAKISKSNKIPTINDFFNYKLVVKKIGKKNEFH